MGRHHGPALHTIILLMASLWLTPMAVAAAVTPAPADSNAPAWQDWSPAAFARARSEHKLVLLDMAAVWCHWCHVMDEKTYSDPAVLAELKQHYITLRVDQDARPDLANRYRDYGWPATIILSADGRDLVKRAGYIPADEFRALLAQTARKPVAETAEAVVTRFAGSPLLTPALRAELTRKHHDSHDDQLGGLRQGMKYLERDSVEYALMRAAGGDAVEARRARQTLDAALALLDPVWGGFYQYSTHGDWQHPHFEKIMPVQAGYLRLYALAWAQYHDPRHARAATATMNYLANFLSAPDGSFLVSQDADLVPGEHSAAYFAQGDAARRRQGMPRIDHHVYARENGLAIEALAIWAAASGDRHAAALARRAAEVMLATRTLPDGGFRHDARDVAGPYLADSLAMSRALLALYSLDGERRWLDAAVAAADFSDRHFRAPGAGYVSAQAVPGITALRVTDENIAAARHFNLLSHYSAQPRFRRMAEQAMRYLATPAVSAEVSTEAGILIADAELAQAPLHLTVVSARRDQAGEALMRVALGWPGAYKRVEYWDKSRGSLPDATVSYPALPRSAGFVCTASRCSLPAFEPVAFAAMITRLSAAPVR